MKPSRRDGFIEIVKSTRASKIFVPVYVTSLNTETFVILILETLLPGAVRHTLSLCSQPPAASEWVVMPSLRPEASIVPGDVSAAAAHHPS